MQLENTLRKFAYSILADIQEGKFGQLSKTLRDAMQVTVPQIQLCFVFETVPLLRFCMFDYFLFELVLFFWVRILFFIWNAVNVGDFL